MSATKRTVLLTGGTGTLGSLAAVALLREGGVEVIAPVRVHHDPDAVERLVAAEFAIAGEPDDATWRERLHQMVLPDGVDDSDVADPLGDLDATVARYGIDEVIHCAGCLSYFDERALNGVNVEMTRRLVEAARRWGARRFVHVSTAFASGFVEGPIGEHLHNEPSGDPTFYTESKRRGERIVAESGLPFLILRPSIVIGDSRDGHYAGPRYGLYQLWSGVERFLLDKWHADVHYVAPDVCIPLLHQDSFQKGFLAAWKNLPDNSICHLTSHGGPTVRELSNQLVNNYIRPETILYYQRLSDVPRADLPPRQRAFLNLASVNIEISSRDWEFESKALDGLIGEGVQFVDATMETVQLCQRAYFEGSDRLRRFGQDYGDLFPTEVVVKEVTG